MSSGTDGPGLRQRTGSRLLAMGADVHFFDPYVDNFLVNDRQLHSEGNLASAVEWSDFVVLVQAHREIVESQILVRAKRILDTRGVLSGDNVERL